MQRLAEATEDDTIIDFSGCIDAADSGRLRATNTLNEYFLKKQKEAVHKSAAVSSRLNSPVYPPPVVLPLAGPHKVDSRETKPGVVSYNEIPMQPTLPRRRTTFQRLFGTHSRTTSTLSTASTLHESPPPSGDQPVFPERLHGSVAHKASAQSLNKPPPSARRSHVSSYASSTTGRASAMSSQSPTSISSRTSLSSIARSTVFKNEVAEIKQYGGFCKSAHLLREGRQKKALIRKEISTFGPVNKNKTFVWTCSTFGCEFEVPAYVDGKRGIVFDDRPRQFDGMRYTLNFLAKSHVTRKDPNVKIPIQYRCVFCNLIGYQSLLFNDQKELLEHVLTHTGSSLGQVELKGGVMVTNSGLVVSKFFDVDFPTTEDGESAQRPSPSPQNSDHSHTVTAVDGSSRRVSVTPCPDENDVEANHWA